MRQISAALLVSACVFNFPGCAEKSATLTAKLWQGDSVAVVDVTALKAKKAITPPEKIILLYSTRGVKKDAVIITDAGVVAMAEERIEKAAFSDIYDLSLDVADSATAPSSITVYRRNDTEFMFEVFGGTALRDQALYNKILQLWQEKRSNGAPVTTPSTDTGSTTIGIKSPESGAKAAGATSPSLKGPATLGSGK